MPTDKERLDWLLFNGPLTMTKLVPYKHREGAELVTVELFKRVEIDAAIRASKPSRRGRKGA